MQTAAQAQDSFSHYAFSRAPISLSQEVFQASRDRDLVGYQSSVASLAVCLKFLSPNLSREVSIKRASSLASTFDPNLVPGESVRGAFASLFARYVPDLVIDQLERYEVRESSIAKFLAERLAWHAPRSVAGRVEDIITGLSLSSEATLRMVAVAAHRGPADTVEFVPSYPLMPPEALNRLLKVYIDCNPSLVPIIIKSVAAKLGNTPAEQRERLLDLADHTVRAGGAESFLYFVRDFFGEVDSVMTQDVAQIVDAALSTESGKRFFLENEATGRLNSGLVRYILRDYDVDRAAGFVARRQSH